MERLDFHYEISDERLIAYSRMPILDRLKWLDDVRRFTLMVRAAPAVSAAPRATEAHYVGETDVGERKHCSR